jgi:hypothetical protein
MLVEGVFWFHPLVWWIGAKLVDARERACDEDVLRELGDPDAYAEGILKVCRRYVEASLVCVSGISGADLRIRVEAIAANRIGSRLQAAKACVLIAVVAGDCIAGDRRRIRGRRRDRRVPAGCSERGRAARSSNGTSAARNARIVTVERRHASTNDEYRSGAAATVNAGPGISGPGTASAQQPSTPAPGSAAGRATAPAQQPSIPAGRAERQLAAADIWNSSARRRWGKKIHGRGGSRSGS